MVRTGNNNNKTSNTTRDPACAQKQMNSPAQIPSMVNSTYSLFSSWQEENPTRRHLATARTQKSTTSRASNLNQEWSQHDVQDRRQEQYQSYLATTRFRLDQTDRMMWEKKRVQNKWLCQAKVTQPPSSTSTTRIKNKIIWQRALKLMPKAIPTKTDSSASTPIDLRDMRDLGYPRRDPSAILNVFD